VRRKELLVGPLAATDVEHAARGVWRETLDGALQSAQFDPVGIERRALAPRIDAVLPRRARRNDAFLGALGLLEEIHLGTRNFYSILRRATSADPRRPIET